MDADKGGDADVDGGLDKDENGDNNAGCARPPLTPLWGRSNVALEKRTEHSPPLKTHVTVRNH